MAGIKEAMKRVMDGRNQGVVIGKGEMNHAFPVTEAGRLLTSPKGYTSAGIKAAHEEIRTVKYLIIELYWDRGWITVYDYGSDVHIADDLELSDRVELRINDNWNATWVELPEIDVVEAPKS